MQPLLAEAVAPNLDALLSYGPLGVFTLVILYFVIRWGDKVAAGHVELVKVCGETEARNASSLESISDAVKSLGTISASHDDRCEKTLKIASMLAKGHSVDSGTAEAKRWFDRAVEESQNP